MIFWREDSRGVGYIATNGTVMMANMNPGPASLVEKPMPLFRQNSAVSGGPYNPLQNPPQLRNVNRNNQLFVFAEIESQRLEMERDRQAREQRNHELQLKMLEALGGRGNQAGPSLTELIASVEALRNLAGNAGGLAGFKEVLEIADRINSLRGDGKEEDSWLGVLKSLAPEVAQAVTQVLLARNGSCELDHFFGGSIKRGNNS
jgi:hypothetical protein